MDDPRLPNHARHEWNQVAMALAEGKITFRDETARKLLEPATLRLVGNVGGKRVIDAACGDGWLSELLVGRGAEVTGVDISDKMIELALFRCRANSSPARFHVADLGDLHMLPGALFDLAVCQMALMSIRDYRSSIRELARVLKPNGRLVWSVLHPCFLSVNDFPGLGWAHKTSHWNPASPADRFIVDRYFDLAANKVQLAPGISVHHFHRPLSVYFTALEQAGFATIRVLEPTLKRRKASRTAPPSYRRVAYYLVAESTKCADLSTN
jgi:2-polyprenyl-3-methyl-5-hydroxy-6-metoxy-1,4-benzoquinol methylase